jgi:hypothetical protein
MTIKNRLFVALLAVGVSGTTWADAQCAVEQEGNTWNMVCSDSGGGDSDLWCEYSVSINNEDGASDSLSVSGLINSGQSGVIIWSGIEHGGSAIQSVSVDSGNCTEK